MPFSILKNPFSEPKKRKTDDAELVGELLGPEEEAEMREALGDQPVDEEITGDDTIRLSEEEEVAKKKVEEEASPEQRRKDYIEWAEEIDKDEEWVDEIFVFHDDGSVEAQTDISLRDVTVKSLPPSLMFIKGYLALERCKFQNLKELPIVESDIDLSQNNIKDIQGLQNEIKGHLDLGDNPIKDLSGLSGMKIKYNLNLAGILAEEIPDDIGVGGTVEVEDNQQKLIEDLERKNYKVHVYSSDKSF